MVPVAAVLRDLPAILGDNRGYASSGAIRQAVLLRIS